MNNFVISTWKLCSVCLFILVIVSWSVNAQRSRYMYTMSNSTTPLTTESSIQVIKPKHKSQVVTIQTDENEEKCPELSGNMDDLTQEQITAKLTDSCRYDRLIKPSTNGSLDVFMQIDVRHIESIDQLQFKAHLLVNLRYLDSRLKFENISPTRKFILGEEPLRNKIWVPHIIIRNERDAALMGLDGKDVFVSISPQGNVIYSYRMTANFYCWMNLQKFPFDSQICDLKWVSWTYNVTNLMLRWEKDRPFQVAANLHLTEFVLDKKWTERGIVPAGFTKGGLEGNFSATIFKFKLTREVGYYVMDYFLPSMLLVFMSWVSFWLQADASPARTTLGTATMLSFITLNGGVTKNLPKVSYIKASEIWFLGCAFFIFCSLAEFAFVNVIWRRKKKVELKKQNSKYILKGAITPSLARKEIRKAESVSSLYKTRSESSLDGENGKSNISLHGFSSLNIPTITTQSQDDLVSDDGSRVGPINDQINAPTWTTMSPQEVAIWIDKKSRVFFPVAFLVFNVFYWSFVYVL